MVPRVRGSGSSECLVVLGEFMIKDFVQMRVYVLQHHLMKLNALVCTCNF